MAAMKIDVDATPANGASSFSASKPKDKKKPKEPQAKIGQLFQFATTGDWVLIVIAAVGSLACGACMPMLIYLFSASIETIGETNMGTFDMSEAEYQAVAMVITGIGFWVTTALYMAAMDIAKTNQVARYKKAYLKSIVRQDVAWFDLNSPQELASKVGESIVLIEEGISNKFIQFFENLGTGVGCVVLALIYAWDVSLVVLATMPLVILAGALLNYVQQRSQATIQAAYATAGGVASETLYAIRTVAAFGLEVRLHRLYSGSLAQAERAGIREAWMAGLAMATFIATPFLMIAAGLYYGGAMLYVDIKDTEFDYSVDVSLGQSAWDGLLTAANLTRATLRYCTSNCTSDQYDPLYVLSPYATGTCADRGLDPFRFTCLTAGQRRNSSDFDFYSFFAQDSRETFEAHAEANGSQLGCDRQAWKVLLAMIAVQAGAQQLGITGQNLSALNKARTAAVGVIATIQRKPPVDALSDEGKTLESVEGRVELIDVVFAYPAAPAKTICNGYSLTVEPGKVVALCGPSGSGKSTVIALLERFYDPQGGQVLLDGVDIRMLNVRWLRQQLGLVSQEPILFMGTVAENIEYGKEGATRSEVEAAASLSNAHNFVSKLPEGYQTQVGQGGSKLSGGQKQRIAIARAIIKAPSVLLLDEATSALDTRSERVVQAALDKVMSQMKRSTITIAHRLSTIKYADKIAVVSMGAVVEQGTFDELMAKEGHFYKLSKTMEGGRETRASRVSLSESSVAEESVDVKGEDDSTHHGQAVAAEVVETPPPKKSFSLCGGSKSDKPPPTEEEKRRKEIEKALFSKLMAHQAPGDRCYFLLGSFFALCNGGAMPATGLIFTKVLMALYEPNPGYLLEAAMVWASAYMLAGILVGIAGTGEAGCFGTTGQHLTRRLRDMSMANLLRMEVGYFDREENSSGALTSFLSEKITLVQAMNGEKLGAMVRTVCTMVVGLTIAFIYGYWQLSLVMLASIIPLSLAMMIQMIVMVGADQVGGGGGGGSKSAGGLVGEVVVGIRTVASFCAERRFYEAYCKQVDAEVGSCCKGSIYRAWAVGVAAGFGKGSMFMVFGAVFYYGFYLINEDITRLSAIDPVSTGGCPSTMDDYLLQFMVPIMVIMFLAMGIGMSASMATDAKKAKSAALQFFERVERVSSIDPLSEQGASLPSVQGGIELRSVDFSYPTRPEVKVCDGYSLMVEPGQVVALCGPSGSGKSTVIALLERFYDPQRGQVLLDGVDIRTLNVRWLRQQLGLVGQEPILFMGTVAENIEYGKEGATRAEVEAAAKMANAHDFITQNLGDKYDTNVGTRGGKLSGGQKQRIAIARALVRQPSILLLDEATSALDYESEGIVQAALDQLMAAKERTTIQIAHRLNTICQADKIAVVSGGKVVEQGTHDELLDIGEGGVYAQLWDAQN